MWFNMEKSKNMNVSKVNGIRRIDANRFSQH